MSALKSLAQKAKYRLRMVSNDEVENKSYVEACLSARVQYAIIATQKKVEDDPLYGKVKKLLSKDLDTTSPLKELIDEKNFDSLDEQKREKYLFALSKRYNKIKEHLDPEFKSAI